MKFMLEAVLDSFLRAVIRFWDNRFLRKPDVIELYKVEMSDLRSRNRELTNFIFNALAPNTAESNESENSDEELQSIGKPIETFTQKRRRLEQESLASWNKLVQQIEEDKAKAKEKLKTIQELEDDVLGASN